MPAPSWGCSLGGNAALAAFLFAIALGLGLGCGSEREDRATPLPRSEVSPEQAREIAALQALGYVEGDQPAPSESGVTLHKRNRVSSGYNLYTSEHAARIFLLDMQGVLLHMWELPITGFTESPKLRRVKLFDNGDILVLMKGLGLIRIDRENRVLWRLLEPAHHDFDVLDDGTIYLLTRETAIYPAYNAEKPIRDDFVVILDPDGTQRQKISLLHAMQNSSCCGDFLEIGMEGDVFHSNTLEVLDGRLQHKHPAFRRGNVLTSWRALDAIGIIDVDREEVVWRLEDTFRMQHQPTVLDSGNLLVFDNFDYRRGPEMSRVVEIDPVSREIHWEFHSTESFAFFSKSGGSNAQLENGNILISETRKGRVFEVSPDGEIVWIYSNPARVGYQKRKIARIYELQRLTPERPWTWLSKRSFPADALTRHTEVSP